jgi:sarcosine oxidase subunit beta
MSADRFGGGPILVIGGGIIGCSIAFHLAALGQREVTVVEAGLLGQGATAKATGGIRQQFSSAVNAALAFEAVRYFQSFEERVGEPFEFRQHGYLFLLSTPTQLEAFRAAVVMQQGLGIDAELVDPQTVAGLVPGIRTDDLLGASYCPSDGSGSPADAVAAFARQARRRGVRFLQRCPVVAVSPSSDGFVVQAGGEELHAEVVVNAAGPWARDVGSLVGLDLPVEPHPRQAFAIGPVPGLGSGMPLTVDLSTGVYVHPGDHGHVVGGGDRGREVSYEPEVRWSLVETMIDALVARLPAMAGAAIRSGWCGLREMTPDDHAIVGPSPVPNWWNAVGFSGHGFMQSPVIGDRVARWLLGMSDGADLAPLRLERFDETPPAPEAVVF